MRVSAEGKMSGGVALANEAVRRRALGGLPKVREAHCSKSATGARGLPLGARRVPGTSWVLLGRSDVPCPPWSTLAGVRALRLLLPPRSG